MTSDFQQQYHVTKLGTFNNAFPLLDFAALEPGRHPSMGVMGQRPPGCYRCQMFIKNIREARLVVYRPDSLLSGIHIIGNLWPLRDKVKIKSIQYALSALPSANGHISREMFDQEFLHKVKFGDVFLYPKENLLVCQDGELFKKYALNQLLDTDRFPGVSGIQFIA